MSNGMKQVQDYNQKVRSARKMPELKSGDIVKIHRRIKEGNKERIQVFEGIIISVKGKQSSSPMVTVRRVAHGTGVEITIPLYSPTIEKIEKIKRAGTRKSKLYYLRESGFKLSKLKMKDLSQFVVNEPEEEEFVEEDVQNEEKKDVASEKKEEAETKK